MQLNYVQKKGRNNIFRSVLIGLNSDKWRIGIKCWMEWLDEWMKKWRWMVICYKIYTRKQTNTRAWNDIDKRKRQEGKRGGEKGKKWEWHNHQGSKSLKTPSFGMQRGGFFFLMVSASYNFNFHLQKEINDPPQVAGVYKSCLLYTSPSPRD